MAGLKCFCGNNMSNGSDLSNPEMIIYDWLQWIKICEDNKPVCDIDEPKEEWWRCPECGRITVIDSITNKQVRCYKIEYIVDPDTHEKVMLE